MSLLKKIICLTLLPLMYMVFSAPLTFGEQLNSSDTAYTAQRVPYNTMLNSACNWSGTWKTNWGNMILTQNGDSVTGHYDNDKGKITGQIQGGSLVGMWSESPTHQPSSDAGDVRFHMSADCGTFSGDWRYGMMTDNKPWYNNNWHGTRILPASINSNNNPPVTNTNNNSPVTNTNPAQNTACNWTGTWETNWGNMVLTQNEYSVIGTYEHDQGKITGQIQGGSLVGMWSESPSYQPSSDAGDIRFHMSPGCGKFSGDWRYGTMTDNQPWSNNNWHGTRK